MSKVGYVLFMTALICVACGLPKESDPFPFSEVDLEEMRAAEQGGAEAQYSLGMRYAQGLRVEHSMEQALEWWRRAALQGHHAAQWALDDVESRLGITSTREIASKDATPPAPEVVPSSLLRAAERGDAEAQFDLGELYFWGEEGVPKKPAEAVKWYRKAAEQGHAQAQSALGRCFSWGQGVPQDHVEANRWFYEAAQQGDASGQINISIAYDYGLGVSRDLVIAYMWMKLAARTERSAREDLSSLARDMTREQIHEAERLAQAWRPREVSAFRVMGHTFLYGARLAEVTTTLGRAYQPTGTHYDGKQRIISYTWHVDGQDWTLRFASGQLVGVSEE